MPYVVLGIKGMGVSVYCHHTNGVPLAPLKEKEFFFLHPSLNFHRDNMASRNCLANIPQR